MIIFLYGPDDYRRSQKKRDLSAEFLKKRSEQGIGVFDLTEDGALAKFEEFLENQSLFESAKFAVLENAFEIPAAQLAKVIQPFAERKTTAILISERDKPVKALAFLTKKPVMFQEFKNLTGVFFERFALDVAKKNGVALDAAAMSHLAAVYAGDSWGLATELAKLAAFKPKIARRDLDALDLDVAPAYWPLLMGVRSPDMRNRLFAFETLIASGDPPAKIFNILASQWREKTHEMAEFDFAVKSGKLEYDDALLALLL
jgi:DNA polymerase III delta subunit